MCLHVVIFGRCLMSLLHSIVDKIRFSVLIRLVTSTITTLSTVIPSDTACPHMIFSNSIFYTNRYWCSLIMASMVVSLKRSLEDISIDVQFRWCRLFASRKNEFGK